MVEFLQMVGFLAVVFAASLGISYFITRSKRKSVQLVPLPENARVRMVGPGGSYRCFYLRRNKHGLIFSAPIQRDHYVPVRIGESMMVQAPLSDSILTFRTSVVDRDVDTHEFTLATPERVRHVDRRSEKRDSSLSGSIIRLNDEPASLKDLSAGGAKVISNALVRPGDTVKVELPGDYGVIYGWALEAIPTAYGTGMASELRVRFEEPLSGLAGIQRRHHYLGR